MTLPVTPTFVAATPTVTTTLSAPGDPFFIIPAGTKPVTRALAVDRLVITYRRGHTLIRVYGHYLKKDGTPGKTIGSHLIFTGSDRYDLVKPYVEAYRPPSEILGYQAPSVV